LLIVHLSARISRWQLGQFTGLTSDLLSSQTLGVPHHRHAPTQGATIKKAAEPQIFGERIKEAS